MPQRIDAVIEYTHRLTSGLLLLIVIAWVIGAVRGFEKGHMARRAAGWTLIFTITESLVGAALVLLALVGENDSVARAYVMAAHLVNTSLLTAAITLMAWSWREHAFPRLKFDRRAIWPMLSLLSVLVISASGAVTALGDTLYPVHAAGSVSDRIANDHALGAHFLQRLRALHPMFAFVLSAGLVAYAAQQLHDDRRPVRRCAAVLAGLVLFQLALGVSNVWLSAPGWLQVIHLAAATSVWVVLVLLTAYSLEQRAGTVIGMAEGQAMSAPPA